MPENNQVRFYARSSFFFSLFSRKPECRFFKRQVLSQQNAILKKLER